MFLVPHLAQCILLLNKNKNPIDNRNISTYYCMLRYVGKKILLFAFIIIIIFSCKRAAVRRRFAGNAAHFAVRDALQALRGPAALLRNSPARRARINMTRGWAVESGGSTSCEWKEGGNAACSALVNCPTVHEAAKWDSPHCQRQRRR